MTNCNKKIGKPTSDGKLWQANSNVFLIKKKFENVTNLPDNAFLMGRQEREGGRKNQTLVSLGTSAATDVGSPTVSYSNFARTPTKGLRP